jgi:hypothetical protein
MSKDTSPVAVFLRSLYRAAERLSDEEVADVAAGRKRLEVHTVGAGNTGEAKAEMREPSDFGSLISALKAAETRELGQQILDDAKLTREGLARLAKALDLPVLRTEGTERIREKIIETTVGFRLRSKAIHG